MTGVLQLLSHGAAAVGPNPECVNMQVTWLLNIQQERSQRISFRRSMQLTSIMADAKSMSGRLATLSTSKLASPAKYQQPLWKAAAPMLQLPGFCVGILAPSPQGFWKLNGA